MDRGMVLNACIIKRKERVPHNPRKASSHRLRPKRANLIGPDIRGMRMTPSANRPMAVCQTVKYSVINLTVMLAEP